MQRALSSGGTKSDGLGSGSFPVNGSMVGVGPGDGDRARSGMVVIGAIGCGDGDRCGLMASLGAATGSDEGVFIDIGSTAAGSATAGSTAAGGGGVGEGVGGAFSVHRTPTNESMLIRVCGSTEIHIHCRSQCQCARMWRAESTPSTVFRAPNCQRRRRVL